MRISKLLEGMIAEAMKSQDDVRVKVYRLIRDALINASNDKRFLNSPMTDQDEKNVLLRMHRQYEDSIAEFKSGRRKDLLESRKAEDDVILSLIQLEPTEKELKAYVKECMDELSKELDREVSLIDTRSVIELVHRKYNSDSIVGIVEEMLKQPK